MSEYDSAVITLLIHPASGVTKKPPKVDTGFNTDAMGVRQAPSVTLSPTARRMYAPVTAA